MLPADPDRSTGIDDPAVPDAPVDPVLAAPPASAAPAARALRRPRMLVVATAVVAILAGSVLFMSGYTMGLQASSEPGTPAAENAAFQPFWDTYHTINDEYAGGAVDREVLIQGAIRGMIASLGDPYSQYLTSVEYRQSLQGISGQFEGIGVVIGTKARDGTAGCTTLGPDCLLVVTNPLPDSPAEHAGLQAGDLILKADGLSLDGLDMNGARNKIAGPRGTVVTLTVQRGTGAPFELAITRDVVQQKEVDSRTLGGGTVGYVRLSGFNDAAADQFVDALAAHVKAGRTKIIVDLRGNPGGLVTAARKVASQFIGSGVLFWEQDAAGQQLATEALTDGVATDPNLRIVCLIDGGSASASEIVAGALQDTKRATLIGQKSFGKGTVQEWRELTGEGGAFKLTMFRWLTPNKRWIHQVGLTPDVSVTLPDPVPAGADPTLDKALEVLGAQAAVATQRMAA